MPEARNRQVMVNLEETFYNLLVMEVIKNHTTASSLVRSLIIKEFLARGLITQDELNSVLLKA
jgi:hypothetical protein